MTLSLLFSEVGLFFFGLERYRLRVKKEYTVPDLLIYCIAIGLHYALFNLSHFWLADKYHWILKVVPAKLNGKPEPVRTGCDDAIYWTLWSNMVLSGVAYGVAFYGFYYQLWIDGVEPSHFWTELKIWSGTYWVRLCSVVSGIILCVDVFRIKKFY